MMNKKKVLVAALVLALVLSIGGVLAYFSETDTKTNTFTVGSVSIQLTEPAWDENGSTAAQTVLPNQKIDKDPTITNNGNNDAYVFIKVEIPKATVVVEDENGTGATSSSQLLFTPIKSDGTVGVNDGWELVSETEGTNSNVYIYSYSSSDTMTTLESGDSTVPLFNKIQFANVQEGWNVEGTNYNVVVTGYAIQTENLTESNYTNNEQVWSVLSANEVHKP